MSGGWLATGWHFDLAVMLPIFAAGLVIFLLSQKRGDR